MHTEVDYNKVDPARKDTLALRDLKEWLGIKRYQTLTSEFRLSPKWDKDKFHNVVSLSGVQGYPVDVWYKVIWPDNPMG